MNLEHKNCKNFKHGMYLNKYFNLIQSLLIKILLPIDISYLYKASQYMYIEILSWMCLCNLKKNVLNYLCAYSL